MATVAKDSVPTSLETTPSNVVTITTESVSVTASSAPSDATSGKTTVALQVPKTETPAVAKPGAPTLVVQVTARRPSQVASSAVVAPAASSGSSRTTTKSKKKKGSGAGSQGAQGENTGRWTAEEHRLFLQGLEQHGKGWKKIASLIKSRTVVQIRTHAQKYFQKLAKARQNGEEGDVTMEGRGGVAAVPSVATAAAAQNNKRRRQTTGTKRKAIHSVVVSAQRQGKKMAISQATPAVPNPVPPLPSVAPALAHFVLPNASESGNGGKCATSSSCVSSITTAQGTISGPALEDSLFRFLTPAPVAAQEPQLNDVARQAGANPITLPTDNPSTAPTVPGEVSPTGVADVSLYPSWTDAKDTPSWYAKGADVDALLDVGDSLDWLADTGDLHETYQPPSIESAPTLPEIESSRSVNELGQTSANNSGSVSSLPHVDSNVESVVPPLPSLFEGSSEPTVTLEPKSEDPIAPTAPSNELPNDPTPTADMDDHLQVFDSPMEEQEFVSTILENSTESSDCLPLS